MPPNALPGRRPPPGQAGRGQTTDGTRLAQPRGSRPPTAVGGRRSPESFSVRGCRGVALAGRFDSTQPRLPAPAARVALAGTPRRRPRPLAHPAATGSTTWPRRTVLGDAGMPARAERRAETARRMARRSRSRPGPRARARRRRGTAPPRILTCNLLRFATNPGYPPLTLVILLILLILVIRP